MDGKTLEKMSLGDLLVKHKALGKFSEDQTERDAVLKEIEKRGKNDEI